jgi:prephenate dehydrogenase
LKDTDLVVVCTPIKRILELLEGIAEHAPPGVLVTDVGSTKRKIMERAKNVLTGDRYFVGGHPMAGSEKAGVMAADPFLFQNAIYILVSTATVPAQLYEEFSQLLRRLGARVLELTAEVHDQVVAAISHLPQVMATSLVNLVGRLNEEQGHFTTLAAGGFRDLTRIASSPFAPVWSDIFGTNADEIRAMIDRYIEILVDIRERLDDAGIEREFSYANAVRSTIPRDAKGFLHTLEELLVVAEDKPGVIAEIANALAGQEININDIEVMKVREGEGGTLRLGFEEADAAEGARRVLTDLGYVARRP